jgi:hypothetical protein
MWTHNTYVNMWAKCWLSHSGTQSPARKEDVAPEHRFKGEGESRRDEASGGSGCDGEPVGDSRRDGEPNRFIASAR